MIPVLNVLSTASINKPVIRVADFTPVHSTALFTHVFRRTCVYNIDHMKDAYEMYQ